VAWIFVTLDDGTAQVEVSVFKELFEAHRLKLEEDQVSIGEGKVSEDCYTGGLRVVADQLLDLATVRARLAKELRLSCNGGSDTQRLLARLKPYVNRNTVVTVDYQNECARGELELELAWKITLDEHLLSAWRDCWRRRTWTQSGTRHRPRHRRIGPIQSAES
jgi:DNA polymerase III subunit alpha